MSTLTKLLVCAGGIVLAGGFVVAGGLACTGGDETAIPAVSNSPASSVPAELIAGTWQVRMAKNEARAPFEGRAAWVSYFSGRRDEALRGFQSESDLPALARAHAEYAALYRQGALLAANATLQVYGADKQESDPAEVAYLLGVSGVLTATPEQAAKLGSSSGSKVATVAARDARWAAWSKSATAGTLPDEPAGLAAISGTPGEMPGSTFELLELPLVGEPGTVQAGDPGELWALSRWHEARAREAAPAAGESIDQVIDSFRLAVEPKVERTTATANDTWLFMSAYTSAADLQYAANLGQGRDTTAAMAATSVYAAAVLGCTVPLPPAPRSDGAAPQPGETPATTNVDCLVDAAAHVGKAIEEAMATQNGGQVDGFHRSFADYARAGVLRLGEMAARVRGESEAAGRLRINAFDRSIGNAADPVFYLAMAAWDAGNRNTPRAAELVHQLLPGAPGLTVARAPLDALHIRLSRNAVPGVPMH